MATLTIQYTELVDGKRVAKQYKFPKQLLQEPYNETSLFMCKVEGESMEPMIVDKAMVIADLSQTNYVSGEFYLVFKEQKMWIKQASMMNGAYFFTSINPAYEHLKYALSDCHVVAKVLYWFNDTSSLESVS